MKQATMVTEHVRSLDGYLTKAISATVRANPSIVDLSLGEPWFGPPPKAGQVVRELVGSERLNEVLRRYVSAGGSGAFQRAVAARYDRLYGLSVDPATEVVATAGGASALATLILTVTGPGDEIVVFEPSYMLYERTCKLLGRVPVRIPRRASDGFAIDPEAVRLALTDRTRMVVLNSPENPTGYVIDSPALSRLSEICADRGVCLVHDEVYDDFVFAGNHVPARAIAPMSPHVVQLNSFSKRYGMLGLRLGWIVAAPEVAAEAAKVFDYQSLSVNGLAEEIGVALLDSPEVERWVHDRRLDLMRRRGILLDALKEHEGIRLCEGLPKGGFFVLANVEGLAARWCDPSESRRDPAGRVVADYLLDSAKIAVVPGDIYGSTCSTSIRLVFAVQESRLVEAARRLQQHLS